MFNKYSIKGKYSEFKIYKSNIDSLDYIEKIENNEIMLNNNFIYLENLAINVDDNEINELELSGHKSYKNKKEKKEDSNPKYYEEDLFLDILKEDGIYIIDINNYNYQSPNFKTMFSKFEIGLLTFKLIPVQYITDGLIEGYLLSEIDYDDKKIDLQKNGFIFKDYMNINNKENIKILIEVKKESVYILDHTLD